MISFSVNTRVKKNLQNFPIHRSFDSSWKKKFLFLLTTELSVSDDGFKGNSLGGGVRAED